MGVPQVKKRSLVTLQPRKLRKAASPGDGCRRNSCPACHGPSPTAFHAMVPLSAASHLQTPTVTVQPGATIHTCWKSGNLNLLLNWSRRKGPGRVTGSSWRCLHAGLALFPRSNRLKWLESCPRPPQTWEDTCTCTPHTHTNKINFNDIERKKKTYWNPYMETTSNKNSAVPKLKHQT